MTTRTKTKVEPVCFFCKKGIPVAETARTLATPPGQMPLPAGCAWVICGSDCSELPPGAEVFYRKIGWK